MTRVLIVDDKEENLYYLRALLSANGCEVEPARHGAEALLKARQAPPSVIISDLLMPVMDGYTLLRHWKSDAHLKQIPFIVYTATYTEPEDEQLALNLGADAFILKPSEPDDFLAHLKEVMANAAHPPKSPNQPSCDESVLLHEYNETLIRKLEEKTLQLEESNRQLQKDISARQLAEAALRESEERFRQLAESIDEVFWLSDVSGQQVFYVSPAYEAIWGQSREALYASPDAWRKAVHPDDQKLLSSFSGDAQKTEDTFRIVRPDGTLRWIRSRLYPVRDAHGQIYRLAGVSRDITEYRHLQEQLGQAQKLEAIGRLAGGVAHDFNNMLSVILSYTSLVLLELSPNDPLRGDIEEVLRAGERAADLTRQLLAFSRQQMLAPKVLDLGQIVLDMEKMLRRVLGEDIRLTLRVPRSLGKVYADPSQLEQIVMNLAINARDAMPEGGELTLALREVELDSAYAVNHPGVAPGPYIELTVSDTGAGMDAATRERIFEPFFTTKEEGKGTGLGLSTVFGIVKQSQGHIQVQSEPGKGSTFVIYLPRTNRVQEAPEPPPPSPKPPRNTETILLVEDNEQVREMSRAILQRRGYHVLSAQDGEEALAVSESFSGQIHLLLTDIVMPKMSGRKLAERLTQKRPGLKVLYVSGYVEDPTAHDDKLSILPKPIMPEALLSKVREALSPS